jgi:hypothetical protein
VSTNDIEMALANVSERLRKIEGGGNAVDVNARSSVEAAHNRLDRYQARLEDLEKAAPRKVTPEGRGCDARRCSKHVYSGSAYCEFCCLPMSEHEAAQ